jgi:uncharacterized membrane protein YqiK
MSDNILFAIGGSVVILFVLFVLLRALWRVAEPNEALIISGLGARFAHSTEDSMGFKIVTGKGALVLPGFQTARRMSLDTRSSEIAVSCVTNQGIPVHVRGVVIYKVGDDFSSIANAARRFLDQQEAMDTRIHSVFAGHLRSILGALTVEELIRDRERLTAEVRSSSATEMVKLGLVVDSMQIQEVDDASGYIANLGKPRAAAVASAARIAEARSDQEATEAEQVANTKKAAAVRESQIHQAGFQADVDQAKAKAMQAGPLSEATARQEVVVQETRAAELEAELAERRLQAQVRKPADAKAYETRTRADAERDAQIARAQAEARETELRAVADATRVTAEADAAAHAATTRAQAAATATRATGLAEADATKARGLAAADAAKAKGLAKAQAVEARGLAEGKAIMARADALATNQEAVIAQQLAEKWPEIVAAGAQAFANVDRMVVFNGADGVSDMLTKALSLGGTGLGLARELMDTMRPSQSSSAPQQADNGAAALPDVR